MIRSTSEDGKPVCIAELRGIGVYLDNFAIGDLAEGPAHRRQRFVDALTSGGTLLFSWANAIEVAGPQGQSANAVTAFLDSIGPHWIPLEMNPWRVAEREKKDPPGRAPVSECFMEKYFMERASRQGSTLLGESECSFPLGAVVDWVHEKRQEVRQYGPEVDRALREGLEPLYAEYNKDPKSLDRLLPQISFNEQRPAEYALVHLQRKLVQEKKPLGPNDGLDFCHAAVGAAYARLATLDKHWKRRVESLPEANRLAKVFYAPQLDQLVDLLAGGADIVL